MKNCNGLSSHGGPETPAMPLAINQARWVDLRHCGLAFLMPAKLFLDIRNIVPVCWHYRQSVCQVGVLGFLNWIEKGKKGAA